MKTKTHTGLIILIILLILIVIAIGMAVYAFKVEPFKLEVDKHTLGDKSPNADHIKIVQISDIHIKQDFTHKNFATIVDRINAQNPDIVIFTGDLYDKYFKYNDDENIISELNRIKASLAKIAVWGNHDYGGGGVREYQNIIESGGFTLLKNENSYITLPNGKHMLFTGLDDSSLGSPNMPELDSSIEPSYKVLLIHNAQSALNYQDSDYDIAIGGHSHGGQIDVPLLPFLNSAALKFTSLSPEYGGGMFNLNSGNIKRLYVNTGIGTTKISARFFVPPTISVFNIYI